MIKFTKKLDDPDGRVSKLIFEDETAIAESVVFKYQDRGVICFSVQSGCRVGCRFCGTGGKFVRNLEPYEMINQIQEGLKLIKDKEKIQLMSMSMGEPMDNWSRVKSVVDSYFSYQFFISTVGLRNYQALHDFLTYGSRFKGFGLQFSLHSVDEKKRFKMLGSHESLLRIKDIKDYADFWNLVTDKPVYYNFICTGEETKEDARKLVDIVGEKNHLTLSVLCKTYPKTPADRESLFRFEDFVVSAGIKNWSLFDPDGQDTIGGGCGQLWYVQDKLRKKV